MKSAALFLGLTLAIASGTALGQGDSLAPVTEINLFGDEELVVTASRHAQMSYEAPATVYVVSDEDIKRAGYHDLEEVFHDIPGFDFGRGYGTNYSQIYQRGFRSNNTNRTLLLIDGAEDNELWSNITWISRQYPLTNIKRIEVIHGPASVLYGANAYLGVINVITKSGGELDGVHAQLGGGSYRTGYGELALGKKAAGVDLALTGRLYLSDEHDLSMYRDWADSVYQNTAYHGTTAAGSVYKNDTRDYAVQVRASYRNFTAGVLHWSTREGYGAWYRAAYERTKGTWWHQDNIIAFLEHQAKPQRGMQLVSKAEYRHSGINGDSKSIYQGALTYWCTDNTGWRFEEQVNYDWTPQIKLTTGGQLDFKYLTGDYTTDTLSPVRSVDRSKIRYLRQEGAYAQAEYLPLRDLVVTAGTRLDHNSSFGFVANPRMGVVFMPLPIYTKFLFGTAYQAPTAWELYSTVQTRASNPNLKPERVRTFEFAMGYRSGRSQHEVNFFVSDFKDIIQTIKVTDSVDIDGDGSIDFKKDQHRNLGRRLIYGLELRTKFQIGNRADLALNYSYLNPWDLEGNRKVGDVAENKGNVIGNVRLGKGTNLNLRINLVGPRPTVPTNPVLRVAGYGVAHLTVTQRNLPFKNLEASLSILNLLDKEYFDPGVRTANGDYYATLLPQPRRHVMATISYALPMK